MASDELTFFIGFAAIFVGLGWYLWHLEREVARLAQRVDDASAAQREQHQPDAAAAGAAGGPGQAREAATSRREGADPRTNGPSASQGAIEGEAPGAGGATDAVGGARPEGGSDARPEGGTDAGPEGGSDAARAKGSAQEAGP